jgi:transcriptional regulator with XRE-family HTH domain
MSDDDRIGELRRFLKERRARLQPRDVGMPPIGRRRVRGLRREEVASLAGIGVSWYTALENGDARGVSEATLNAVAGALRLSDSERQYLLALAGPTPVPRDDGIPGPLVFETLHAIAFPAYVITRDWTVLDCNRAFRRVWAIREGEVPFNAVERLFFDPAAQAMHGERFEQNVRPVLAMLRSSYGRHLTVALRGLRLRIESDDVLSAIWNEYEIAGPLLPNACTIESPVGTFRYEALTLPAPTDPHGIVVHVPDAASRKLFEPNL